MRCVISEMRMLPWSRRSALFTLIFFAVLLSTLFGGRQCSFSADQHALLQHREASSEAEQKEALPVVHARMLNVKTNDYGSYDPTPSMEKPHFKLIPN